jgi:hypothetical protein
VKIKKRRDPANFFRVNQNIPPKRKSSSTSEA